jgi:hypothetical protein
MFAEQPHSLGFRRKAKFVFGSAAPPNTKLANAAAAQTLAPTGVECIYELAAL